MRLLLGSGGMGTPERRGPWLDAFSSFLGDAQSFLFVPWASIHHDRYVQWMRDEHAAERTIVSTHEEDDPVRAVESAEAIYVGGGNTFLLLKTLQEHRLLEPIRERVLAGVPFIGVSAGTNVACPTARTTNDMPVVTPRDMQTLGLVPFQINPHYFAGRTFMEVDGEYVAYGGETRDVRIREYHEHNDAAVLGLWEGGWLQIEGDSATIDGAPARLFVKDEEPVDYAPGASVDFLLNASVL